MAVKNGPNENTFGNQAFASSGSKDQHYPKDSPPVENNNTEDDWGNNQARKLAEQTAAKNDARSAEESASRQPRNGNLIENIEQDPEQIPQEGGFFNSNKKSSYQGNKKKGLKKYGPLGAVLGILTTLMITFASSTMFAPFGLVANGLEQFNTLRTSMHVRSSYMLPRMLKSGLNSKITSKGLFGIGSEKFKISDSMSKKLAKNGITYLETTGTDGKPLNLLVYENGPEGKPMAVAAYQGDADRIPDTLDLPSSQLDANGNPITSRIELDSSAKMTHAAAIDSDTGFFRAEERSTRTLKGHIAGWFDSNAEKVDAMLGNHGRNRQGNTSKDASDEEIQRNAESDGLREEAEDPRGSVDVDSSDADADEVTRTPVDDGSGAITKNMDVPAVESALKSRARKAAAMVGSASVITTVAGFGCTALKVINTISQTVGALQRAHILNFSTGFLEVVDKAKAGDSSSELHYYMNNLNKRGPTRDMAGNIIPGKESSSAMMSDAINQFFSNGDLKVKASDPSARKYNTEIAMQQAVFHSDEVASSDMNQVPQTLGSVLGKAAGSLNTYKGCIALQTTGDILGALGDALELITALPSFGLSMVIAEFGKALMKRPLSFAITLAVGGIIAFVAPLIAKNLSKSLVKNMVGEDAGYAINSGFNMYTGKQMQISSGLPATEEKLIAQYEENQKVVASEARFIRETRSPLDPTSEYTFLGSLVKRLTPIASTMSSPLQTFSKIGNVFGSSISHLMPTAYADGLSKLKTSINKNCPSAHAFDKPLGKDAFCNNYFTSDYSTARISPDEVIDQVGADNLDVEHIDENVNNGNPEIKDGSELANWVYACAVRESNYGVADSNIAEALGGSVGVGKDKIKQVSGAAIGSLPVVGALAQTFFDLSETSKIGWTTGENCVKDEYKYFSRYSEDQRVLESAGLIQQSAVTALLDRYYAKHPLDFTDSGIVARYTGMTKEQAEIALGLVEYNQFLAQYNPQDKGPELPLKYEDYQYESTSLIAEILPSTIINRIEKYFEQRLNFTIA